MSTVEPTNLIVIVPAALGERVAGALRAAWAGEAVEVLVDAAPGGDAPGTADAVRARRVAAAVADGEEVALELKLPLRLRRHRGRLRALRLVPQAAEQRDDAQALAWVAAIAAGEVLAIQPLFAAWYDRTFAYLRAILAEPRQAFAATQDVFALVVHDAPRFDPQTTRFAPWLVEQVHRVAADAGLAVDDGDPPRPGAQTARAEVGDRIARIGDLDLLVLLHRLPLRDRRLLLLRHVIGLEPHEAAQALGLDPGEIAARESRAMAALQSRVNVFGRATQPHGSRVQSRELNHLSPVLRARRLALAASSFEVAGSRA